MKLSKNTIIVSVAVVALLVVGGGAVYAYNTPAARAERGLKLANNYLQEAKYQEAIPAFKKLIGLDPKDIPARLDLSKAYVATKDFPQAEVVLKEVIQMDLKNIDAREDLFKVYLKEGNLDAANAILEEIIQIDPKKDVKQLNTDLDSAKAISASKVSYDQGIQQISDKKYLEAMASLQKVIKEDTERFTDAQTKIGDCKKSYVANSIQTTSDLAKANEYDDAIKMLNDVLKIDVNNQDVKNLVVQYTQAIAKVKADAMTLKANNDKKEIIAINKAIDHISDLENPPKDATQWGGLGHINSIERNNDVFVIKDHDVRVINDIPYLVICVMHGIPNPASYYFINLETYAVYSDFSGSTEVPKVPGM